ncbi:MAG: hypothetical protein K6G62_04705 [Eubacterium sp.]|nr:hypothetical protein [Eubacterium sp.]
MKWVRASFTLEATFVVSICVWVLVALCYCGLYIHDQAILESETNACLARAIRSDKLEASGEIRRGLEGKLLLTEVKKVEVKDFLVYQRAQVTYDLNLSFPLLRKIFLGKKTQGSYEVFRESINAAKLRWDGS